MDAEDFLEPDELERRVGRPGDLDPDSLQYKEACDGCATHLSWIDACYVCSHECTWCPECADGCGHVCPNCSGTLRRRPRRTQAVKPIKPFEGPDNGALPPSRRQQT